METSLEITSNGFECAAGWCPNATSQNSDTVYIRDNKTVNVEMIRGVSREGFDCTGRSEMTPVADRNLVW